MKQRIKIGIFFGGPSREREISFAGGRTVYDNLDKALFEPVPIFIDSLGNFILLDWQHIYKGSIRDFYPPSNLVPKSRFQIYIESLGPLDEAQLARFISCIGQRVIPGQFASLFDLAFLALHGPYGEDGTLQGLLEWFRIPYTGTSILGSALGIDKLVQKKWMQCAGFALPAYQILSKSAWEATTDKESLFKEVIQTIGLPLVIKSPCQGSSIGVSVVKEKDVEQFIEAVNGSLFIQKVTATMWQALTSEAKQQWVTSLIDFREGIGLPIIVNEQLIYHPDALLQHLDNHFANNSNPVQLVSPQGEAAVLLEAYVQGREFSCIVLEEEPGKLLALPPTEMVKGDSQLNYRAKYLPGVVHKETPIQLPLAQVQAIRQACVQLFQLFNFQVYARIDGFITSDCQIYLNDPNTTAGMNPSSFLFHQAAEIGLGPTQLLTFLIRTSLTARMSTHKAGPYGHLLLDTLDANLTNKLTNFDNLES